MSDINHKTRVSFSVINCISHDQRVLKIAETVSNLDCEITIIGRITEDCDITDIFPFRIHRFRMLFKKGFFFYMFYNIRLFFYLLFHKNDLLVSNDLDTLLPNYLVSKLKRLPLVYDSHEYFTNLPEVQHRKFVKWVWTSIEKNIFPNLRYVMTVSKPIAHEYQKLYNVLPLVVRNAGKNADNIIPYTRAEIDVSENDMLIILQGAGINMDKGAEELLDAVNTSEGITLLIVGSGDMFPLLKQRVKELNIKHKVKIIPRVPWDTLMKFTKSADLGMCLEKDTNLNYRYSLPNKLFDYISAGIPVLASNLPETGKIIDEYGCGQIIPSVTPQEITKALSELKNDKVKLAELKRNSIIASRKLNWENESEQVKELYTRIFDEIE